jgi:RNA polymerase sigma-54 factor
MDMRLGQHLGLHMRTQLVMTQRLQQALKLLQVPTLELEQILRQELQANPLLEEIDLEEDEEETAAEREEAGEAEAAAEAGAEEPADAAAADAAGDEEESPEPVDWDEYFKDGFVMEQLEPESEDEDQLERLPVYVPSGQQSLLEQLTFAVADPVDRRIGEYIIGSLNEDGYLAASLREIAAFFEIDEERVAAVLAVIQEFDPPGVAARDLQECLLLQLRARGRSDSAEAVVIRDHFEALKTHKYADIARELKVPVQEVQAIAERIGELDPKPGLSTGGEGARFIVPDLVVQKVDDEYVVYLNDGNLPRLRVSRAYEDLTRRGPDRDNKTVQFIDEKRRYAEWIIKTIEQRRRTMIKVMEAIVRQQEDFFERGAIALKPLTLQQVASAIEMHESTVSRVTKQKYVQTPRGVFPLKYFFSAGLDTDEGEEVAAKAVKEMIQEIVAGENPQRPLSDKKIVDLLAARGLKIARRTVAKYREQMGILAARMRKKF